VKKKLIRTLNTQGMQFEGMIERWRGRRRVQLLDSIKGDKSYVEIKRKVQDLDEWRGLSLA